jgi:hypothetical protein
VDEVVDREWGCERKDFTSESCTDVKGGKVEFALAK